MRHIMISLLALSLIACNLLAPSEEARPVETTLTSEPVPTAIDNPQNFDGQEIRDERAGFAFNVPADWYTFPFGDTSDALAYSFTAQSIEPGVGGGGFPEGETKIDVNVETPATGNWTLETVEADLREQNSNSVIERITLATGVEAIRVSGTNQRGESFSSIYTVFNAHRVSFFVLGDLQYLDQIANTTRSL